MNTRQAQQAVPGSALDQALQALLHLAEPLGDSTRGCQQHLARATPTARIAISSAFVAAVRRPYRGVRYRGRARGRRRGGGPRARWRSRGIPGGAGPRWVGRPGRRAGFRVGRRRSPSRRRGAWRGASRGGGQRGRSLPLRQSRARLRGWRAGPPGSRAGGRRGEFGEPRRRH